MNSSFGSSGIKIQNKKRNRLQTNSPVVTETTISCNNNNNNIISTNKRRRSDRIEKIRIQVVDELLHDGKSKFQILFDLQGDRKRYIEEQDNSNENDEQSDNNDDNDIQCFTPVAQVYTTKHHIRLRNIHLMCIIRLKATINQMNNQRAQKHVHWQQQHNKPAALQQHM